MAALASEGIGRRLVNEWAFGETGLRAEARIFRSSFQEGHTQSQSAAAVGGSGGGGIQAPTTINPHFCDWQINLYSWTQQPEQ